MSDARSRAAPCDGDHMNSDGVLLCADTTLFFDWLLALFPARVQQAWESHLDSADVTYLSSPDMTVVYCVVQLAYNAVRLCLAMAHHYR